MGEGKGQEWKGVERLAHDLGLHDWDQGDDGFGGEWIADEKKLEKLRERLEPLLEAADKVNKLAATLMRYTSEHPSTAAEWREKITKTNKELATWR